MKRIFCCLFAMFLLCGAIPASAQGEITDVQVQVSNPKQTVTITGAFDSRVSGRLATLQVLAEGIKLDEAADLDAQMRENVIFAWQTESEANGVFTFTIVIDKEAEPGDYYYLIGGEYVEQPYVSFFSYVGLEEVNKVVEKINSAATSEALRSILLEEYDILGIDIETFKKADNSLQLQVCSSLLAQKYESGTEFVDQYEKLFVYETKQAELLDALKQCHYLSITETLQAYQEYLEIDYTEYNGYSQTQQENVQKELAGKDFSGFEAIKEAFYDAVEKYASNRQEGPSGGSGSGGSGSGGGSSSGNIIAERPPITLPDEIETVLPFSDLDSVSWAVDSILYLSDREIINGYDDGSFQPNQLITREEFTKLVVSAFGLFDAKADCAFGDVTEDMWYYKFVASAFQKGVVNGQSDTVFGAGEAVTRQDIAAMAYRAANASGIKIPAGDGSAEFSDQAEIDSYALEAVSAMASSGIINGIGENEFAPKQNATRAQAAKIIAGLLQLQQ